MRYLLTLALCLWASWAGAFPPGFLAVATSGGSDAPADYCSDKLTGGWSLYYDADHPTNNTTACISGSTATVTYSTGVTVSDAVNTTSGGTYGALWDGSTNSYLNVPATGITTQNGRVEVTITTSATIPTATVGIWEWYTSSTTKIIAYLYYSAGQYSFRAAHADGTAVSGETALMTLAGSTAYTATVDWNSTLGTVYVSFGGTAATSGAGTLSAFTTPTNGVRFGEDQNGPAGGDVGWGFDDIKMGPSTR